MNVSINSLLGVIILLVLISSCKKNELEPNPSDIGEDYFPVSVGTEWIYRVDSVVYDDFNDTGTIDTIVYYAKHLVEDTFRDATGILIQKVGRYLAKDTFLKYNLDAYLTYRKVDYRVEVQDSSGRYVKLLFPPSVDKYWDGNAYNARNSEDYQIIDKKSFEVIDGVEYKNTLHVLHRDEKLLVQRRYGIEKYAKHIGMVHKNNINIDIKIQDTTSGKKGFDCTYNLISFKR